MGKNGGTTLVYDQSERGVCINTVMTCREIWESLPAERVLVFQVGSTPPSAFPFQHIVDCFYMSGNLQADSVLCGGSAWRVRDFFDYDFVGAPWRRGKCPAGHDIRKSMCEDDYMDMVSNVFGVIHALLCSLRFEF